jgi:GNAT superfamily N-acetyltransferase
MPVLPVTDAPPPISAADAGRLGHYQLRLLSVCDAPLVQVLRDDVLSRLEHPDLYVREPDEAAFVAEHLPGHALCRGETIGVFDGTQLVAYAMLGLPAADDPHHLGMHIPHGGRALGQVAHLASCMVHPGHRGQGLQRRLLAARFSLAQAQGRPLCVAMVSLHNHASRHNLMRAGLRIVHVGDVTGLKRQLVALDLERSWKFDEAGARLVAAGDYEQQSELSRAGWWGIAMVEGPGSDSLVFAHRQVHEAPR